MTGERHSSWRHQLAGKTRALAIWAAGYLGVMLAMAMGSGKTKLAIDLIEATGSRLVLVVCPMRIIEVWRYQLEQHAAFPYLFRSLDERAGSVHDKARIARDAIAQARIAGQVCILAINYESVWREPFSALALNTLWPLVIADECVPPGSLISTPNGDVPIESLRENDAIYGYDHATNTVTITTITTTFHHQTANPLIAIHEARLTPEHPVWTFNRGYIPAHLVRESDEVLIVKKNPSRNLPTLPEAIHGATQDGYILQQELPLKNDQRHAGGSPAMRRDYAENDFAIRRTEKTAPTSNLGIQPISQPGSDGQGSCHIEAARLPNAQWRQRTRPYGAPISLGATIGLADGMDCADTSCQGIGLPIPLQARHRGTILADCHRSGRPDPSRATSPRTGRPEGCFPSVAGMAGAAVLEPGNSGRPQPGSGNHPVHNLETGTGNYFVNGLLVHNCHRLKSPSGKVSRFMGRLSIRARRRLGLTGTPLPHSMLDAWAQYRFLQPGIFDETYTSFKTRYAIFGGFEGREIKGWREEEDFNRRFYKIAFRVTKEEALPDLPPEMDQALYADLSAQGRKAYDQLEEEFLTWLGNTPEELLTVPNALVLLLRLQQLTGGTLKDDQGTFHAIDDAKEKLLADWLEDLDPTEPAVIFAHFLPDLEAIARACRQTGHTFAIVSGKEKHGIEKWKAGQANILIAQISVASEGQDLTRARYACYYSVGWKLSDYVQSRARIHRAGQTRPVTYYHLLVRNTIDEIILRALEARWDFVETVLKEMKKHATPITLR